jgi:hypothetical protein
VSLPFAGLFGNAEKILYTKFNSILHVIFRGAYRLCFWAQLQREEQAKDILIAMSRKLEVIAQQFANGGWNNIYCLL